MTADIAMNEREIIKAVLRKEMPDFEKVRRSCVTSGNKKHFKFSALCMACTAAMLAVAGAASIYFVMSEQNAVNPYNNTSLMRPATSVSDEGNSSNGEADILKTDIRVNKVSSHSMMKLDIDAKIVNIERNPDEYAYIEKAKLPEGFRSVDSYVVYVRSDRDSASYDVPHDYVFCYSGLTEEQSITVKISPSEEPLRDYFIESKENKTSYIGETELEIFGMNEMYIASFQKDGIYFDIETRGISEKELTDLLYSVVSLM